MRHWRITAAADRTAPEPLYFLSRVAALTSRVAAATSPSRDCRASPAPARCGVGAVGDPGRERLVSAVIIDSR